MEILARLILGLVYTRQSYLLCGEKLVDVVNGVEVFAHSFFLDAII